jgi:hypothetical protein
MDHHILIAALAALAEENLVDRKGIAEAIRRYGITATQQRPGKTDGDRQAARRRTGPPASCVAPRNRGTGTQ